MLNEERVILMTKLASYEENEGRKDVSIGHYFRGDYVTLHVLKAFFGGTIAFVVLLAMYILYDFEVFMQDIYKMDLIAFARNILMMYGVSIVIYCAISYIVFSYRYSKAKKGMKSYYRNLKKLDSMNDSKGLRNEKLTGV